MLIQGDVLNVVVKFQCINQGIHTEWKKNDYCIYLVCCLVYYTAPILIFNSSDAVKHTVCYPLPHVKVQRSIGHYDVTLLLTFVTIKCVKDRHNHTSCYTLCLYLMEVFFLCFYRPWTKVLTFDIDFFEISNIIHKRNVTIRKLSPIELWVPASYNQLLMIYQIQ